MDAISGQLFSGETVVWRGAPPQGLRLTRGDLTAIPFSLLWAGFAGFWNWGVWHDGAPIFFRLWGVPFLLAGFHVVIGRFFTDAWSRSRTTYAVTNRSVIIARGRKVTSLDIAHLPGLSLDEDGDGRGTISFRPEDAPKPMRWPFEPRRTTMPAQRFDSIENPRRVYELIAQATR